MIEPVSVGLSPARLPPGQTTVLRPGTSRRCPGAASRRVRGPGGGPLLRASRLVWREPLRFGRARNQVTRGLPSLPRSTLSSLKSRWIIRLDVRPRVALAGVAKHRNDLAPTAPFSPRSQSASVPPPQAPSRERRRLHSRRRRRRASPRSGGTGAPSPSPPASSARATRPPPRPGAGGEGISVRRVDATRSRRRRKRHPRPLGPMVVAAHSDPRSWGARRRKQRVAIPSARPLLRPARSRDALAFQHRSVRAATSSSRQRPMPLPTRVPPPWKCAPLNGQRQRTGTAKVAAEGRCAHIHTFRLVADSCSHGSS